MRKTRAFVNRYEHDEENLAHSRPKLRIPGSLPRDRAILAASIRGVLALARIVLRTPGRYSLRGPLPDRAGTERTFGGSPNAFTLARIVSVFRCIRRAIAVTVNGARQSR